MNSRKRILGAARGIPLTRLFKGVFITGVPGCGETTALMDLLVQLREGKTLFRVIEPAEEQVSPAEVADEPPKGGTER